MTFKLPSLPYKKNALEPYLSTETLEYHHGAHHKAYVHKLNELMADTPYADMPLEEIVVRAPPGPLRDNAAQAWNHDFYWHSLDPDGGGVPEQAIGQLINQSFGSLDLFRDTFEKTCLELFGSGWVWLVQKPDHTLDILPLGNAGNPMREGLLPLLACDLWEHAYYIDYRNQRAKYLKAFWDLVNWDFAASNLAYRNALRTPSLRQPAIQTMAIREAATTSWLHR